MKSVRDAMITGGREVTLDEAVALVSLTQMDKDPKTANAPAEKSSIAALKDTLKVPPQIV